MIEFFVPGAPVTQGSLKVIHGRVIHAQGSALAAWRSAIALMAKSKGARPHNEPVEIELLFTLKRPKTVTRAEPTALYDLDKLIRAVLDALTAIAYRDDGQVTVIRAQKRYGEEPGVHVKVAPRLPEALKD